MAVLQSYDLKGKKESFANWISNLSPTDTFFVSATGKEAVKNTMFQWQTDSLTATKSHEWKEGEVATMATRTATKVHQNYTQILRTALEVTDTADSLDNYGRTKELAYQMEKAGTEIKRDLEAMLLGEQAGAVGNSNTVRKTSCFEKLVATTADTDTGATVVKTTSTAGKLTEAELFEVTYNLYLSGSKANVIMFHPEHASFFSSLMEGGAGAGGAVRWNMVDNKSTELNSHVGSLIDPLGQRFQLVPNRFMPKKSVYIFNTKDWTQMVLREPSKVQLAKKGSSERWMIEMEVGLRHSNPYASGILKIA